MASSTLCLSIDKGPKAGETLACNPGTVIRIGRVVRGNTVVIKDSSISQKHLNVNFLPEISRWVVTDLGSSNGTYVNGSLISPDEEPTSLSDGDVIKIGELTSISVKISDPVNQPLMIPRCDRPPRPPKQVKLEDKEWEERKEAVRAIGFFRHLLPSKRRKAATAADRGTQWKVARSSSGPQKFL